MVAERLKEYKRLTSTRNQLLRQNRLTGSPVEVDYENMPKETEKAIRELDEQIASQSRSIGLPQEFRGESKVSYETSFSQHFLALAQEKGINVIELAEQHMGRDKRDLLGTYRQELKNTFAQGKPIRRKGLSDFVISLSESGALSQEKVDRLASNQSLSKQEAVVELVLQEFCKNNIYSYFKTSAPKNFNQLMDDLAGGKVSIQEFIKNRETLISKHPNLPINYVKYNPSFSWREGALDDNITNPMYDKEGAGVQPKLFTAEGNPKYVDKAFFDTYGVDMETWRQNPTFDLEQITATKNLDQYELLKATVGINKQINENNNDIGKVSPFLRPQISKDGFEKKLSYFKGGSLANLKEGLTDIVQNKRDELMYGDEVTAIDSEGKAVVSDIKVIPKYYRKPLGDGAEVVTEGTIGATVLALKQSEDRKSVV